LSEPAAAGQPVPASRTSPDGERRMDNSDAITARNVRLSSANSGRVPNVAVLPEPPQPSAPNSAHVYNRRNPPQVRLDYEQGGVSYVRNA